jgi:hypothetical protein
MNKGNPEPRKPVSGKWNRIRNRNENLKAEISDLVAKDADVRRKKFVFFYDEGIKFLNRGIYKEAIRSFEMALKLDSRHKKAQRYLIEAINGDMVPNGKPNPKPKAKAKPKINPKKNQKPTPKSGRANRPRVQPANNKDPIPKPSPGIKSDGPGISGKNDRNIALLFTQNFKVVQKRRAAELEKDLKNAGLLDEEDLDKSFTAKIPNGHGMASEPNGSVGNGKKNVATNCS